MNRKYFTILISLCALLLSVVLVGAQDAGEPTITYSAVFRVSDASEVENSSSQLTRFDNGITASINTGDLEPGDVYTLWWVIFNEPQNCSDGVCNADDMFILDENGAIQRDAAGNRVLNMDGIGAANISVQHAAGSYSTLGTLATSASLGLGSVPGIALGPGLLDAARAEVHLVVRTHGPVLGEAFHDQLSTFGGGCEPMDAVPCVDLQFAIHRPAGQQ